MKRIFLLFFLLQFANSFQSQTDSVYYGVPKNDTIKARKVKKDDWRKKFSFGGYFTLLLNPTYINISPNISYKASQKIIISVGVTYNYLSNRSGSITQTLYGVRPTLNYVLSKQFTAGIGGIYNYYILDYGSQYDKIIENVYGPRGYLRYKFNSNIYLLTQYEKLAQPNFYYVSNPKQNIWVDYLFVGGGYTVPVGNNGSLYTSVMYNLTPSPLSIYPNPIIQIGYLGRF